MYEAERTELFHITQKLYQKDLIQLSSGNVSMRVSAEHVLITPSGIAYDVLEPRDMVVITLAGEVIESQVGVAGLQAGLEVAGQDFEAAGLVGFQFHQRSLIS